MRKWEPEDVVVLVLVSSIPLLIICITICGLFRG